ncbi:MFS transporter [Catenulispora rubra]|uniref:MFS transporter n=1 Tax=Catenulispora rubra TaxID=280293 RepID=UPI001E4496D7|nr:MFS transporter [Catenulispora rubra]
MSALVVPAPALKPVLSRPLTLLLSIACGVAVANIYFPQAISPLIASGLKTSKSSAALVTTCAQFGYAAGIFLLVPLGDRLRHRRLVTTLLMLTTVGLVLAGTADTLPMLAVASTLIGATTVVPQILIPMAAGLAEPERRGEVTGTLLSGLIGGILLARTFSGTLGQWLGWRAPYLVAAVAVLLLSAAMAAFLPTTTPSTGERYPALLAASVRLLRTEPLLRRSCQYQVLVFAAFSAAWTALALHVTGPEYHLGTPAVGVLALVGAGSMFATPRAGRATDRLGPDAVNLRCLVGVVAAAAVLVTGSAGGVFGLVGLAVGMLALDVAMQSGQVANQARIFALRPSERARLNTAYMTCAFLGGSVGSWLGVRAYSAFGWNGVCGAVAILGAVALGRCLLIPRQSKA